MEINYIIIIILLSKSGDIIEELDVMLLN